MRRWEQLTRRRFVADLGRGTVGIVVFGLGAAACGSDDADGDGTSADGSTTPTSGDAATSEPSATDSTDEAAPDPEPAGDPVEVDWTWQRVSFGFVSAYLLAHAGEIVLVDTGVEGSEAEITAALDDLGLGWNDVADVILTHRHPDHVGSLPAVLELATEADGHIGAEDLDAVTSPRALNVVADGDLVAGLQIVATPGHTAGHVSVLDTTAGVLVAGDALNGGGSRGVTGPNPDFSSDMDEANRSLRRLATLEYDTALFGHGSPLVGGASAAVADLAASL